MAASRSALRTIHHEFGAAQLEYGITAVGAAVLGAAQPRQGEGNLRVATAQRAMKAYSDVAGRKENMWLSRVKARRAQPKQMLRCYVTDNMVFVGLGSLQQ